MPRPDPDDFADLFPPDPPASGLTDDDLLTIWRGMHARGPFARGEAMLLMEREIARSHADALAQFRALAAIDYADPAPDFGERRLGIRYGEPCAIVGPALPDPPTEDDDDGPPDDFPSE